MNKQIEENKYGIAVGDKVVLVYAWDADENPTASNFHFTTVTNVFHKDMGNCQLLKFELAGVDYPVSADRVMLVEKGDIYSLPPMVALKEVDCHAIYAAAYSKGFRGRVVSFNHDRTAYEVESGEKIYKVSVHYSDISDGVFASCDCLGFVNRRKTCKHQSLVGISDIYKTVDMRQAA